MTANIFQILTNNYEHNFINNYNNVIENKNSYNSIVNTLSNEEFLNTLFVLYIRKIDQIILNHQNNEIELKHRNISKLLEINSIMINSVNIEDINHKDIIDFYTFLNKILLKFILENELSLLNNLKELLIKIKE
jgi:flagellin-specific chaperone FliS